MKVRMLIGGALGDKPHERGDVLEVAPKQGQRWIAAGIAVPATSTGGDD